jgi:hypothetical protein
MVSWVRIPGVWDSLCIFITTASKARHILSKKQDLEVGTKHRLLEAARQLNTDSLRAKKEEEQ